MGYNRATRERVLTSLGVLPHFHHWRMNSMTTAIITITCEYCGKQKHVRADHFNQRFCSHRCDVLRRGNYLAVATHRRTCNRRARRIMEVALGRTLRPDEHVHHKDGKFTNNVIENLQVLSESEHHSLHNNRGLHSKSQEYKREYARQFYWSNKQYRERQRARKREGEREKRASFKAQGLNSKGQPYKRGPYKSCD